MKKVENAYKEREALKEEVINKLNERLKETQQEVQNLHVQTKNSTKTMEEKIKILQEQLKLCEQSRLRSVGECEQLKLQLQEMNHVNSKITMQYKEKEKNFKQQLANLQSQYEQLKSEYKIEKDVFEKKLQQMENENNALQELARKKEYEIVRKTKEHKEKLMNIEDELLKFVKKICN